MNELTTIQYAWIIYFAGSLGCTLAAWWIFLWAWRFVRYSAVVTVATILFTPYAIDAQTMTMAPAIYTLVFEGMAQGVTGIMPLLKVMLGIWLIGVILAALLVFLTRNLGAAPRAASTAKKHHSQRRTNYEDNARQDDVRPKASRNLSRSEHQARDDLLKGEVPIRAIRD